MLRIGPAARFSISDRFDHLSRLGSNPGAPDQRSEFEFVLSSEFRSKRSVEARTIVHGALSSFGAQRLDHRRRPESGHCRRFAFLLSDDGAWITGQLLHSSGGLLT
jgi:hypothetical protein